MDHTMVVITFPDIETQKKALGFLASRFSGKVLNTGEHIVPEAALAALAERNLAFTLSGKPSRDRSEAGKRAWVTIRARRAASKAKKTARWAITMTKWYITKLKSSPKWELLTFNGPNGGESRGIVDIMAIQKDHRPGLDGLNRGDVFEIILIQVKGGHAPWPCLDDIERLKKVGVRYDAKAIILAKWKKGKQPVLYSLNLDCNEGDPWEKVIEPRGLFKKCVQSLA